ncbi:peptidoglycan-binding protein [Oscillatoriales cyanobacterium LEGE 11467]|uniref:Peptidoglycan-binding protein n=1 Tax=Zarconia navalis LEGE 11467 TaxID=1828826 RepID=A0A928W0M8_9CYAN|nr:peptidoglycan-binding protein [Zarconia navalis]MBE9041776.1 peptidoglycan-binding protein [Zarconia navalis LEGE 11467]
MWESLLQAQKIADRLNDRTFKPTKPLKLTSNPVKSDSKKRPLRWCWMMAWPMAMASTAIVPTEVWALSVGIPGGEALAQNPSGSTLERPVLQLGSQGTDVSELQAALKLLGYYGDVVNGVFDRSTAEAVLGFQEAAGLNPNGIVDAKTWTRLFPAMLPQSTTEPCTCNDRNTSAAATDRSASGDLPLLRLGMQGTAVLGVQQRLQALGFFQGKPDGVFGTDTQAAVEAAQQSYDLQTDGVVGPSTWDVLMR